MGLLCVASKHLCPIIHTKAPVNNQLCGDLICHHHKFGPRWWWQTISPKRWCISPNFYAADSSLVSLFAVKFSICRRHGFFYAARVSSPTRPKFYQRAVHLLWTQWHCESIFFVHSPSVLLAVFPPIFAFTDLPLIMYNSETDSLPVTT